MPSRRSGWAPSSTGRSFPKAVAKVTDDQEGLLEFYGYPAEHWIHLRRTNPIELTCAAVRLRTKVTKGAGAPAAWLSMIFKLMESAQARWRAVNGAHLVSLVHAAARFERLWSSARTRLHEYRRLGRGRAAGAHSVRRLSACAGTGHGRRPARPGHRGPHGPEPRDGTVTAAVVPASALVSVLPGRVRA